MEINKELHKVAVTAIIYDKDGRFLVTKRSPKESVHPNRWTVPGGKLNTDDYINTPQTNGNAGWYGAVEKTLRREVMEEVNIEIGKPEYLLDLTFMTPKGPVLVLSYYAPLAKGEAKLLDPDAVDMKWVTLAEAKNLDLIEGIYDELVMVSDIVKGKK